MKRNYKYIKDTSKPKMTEVFDVDGFTLLRKEIKTGFFHGRRVSANTKTHAKMWKFRNERHIPIGVVCGRCSNAKNIKLKCDHRTRWSEWGKAIIKLHGHKVPSPLKMNNKHFCFDGTHIYT